MAHLSPIRASVPVLAGLELVNRGKVRDTYRLGNGLMLVVATDAVSIYDFVLNALIPEKGYVLTAMTHFWMLYLEKMGIKTHFVAAGSDIDQYLPEHLRGDIDLQRRGMIVRELQMIPVEFITRWCLTGSVLKEYREHGTVYCVKIEEGLQDGDRIHTPLFTPTTKAKIGHDLPINTAGVRTQYPRAVEAFLTAAYRCYTYAAERGIIAADTKAELDADGVIGDEWFTPDSSRFWDAREWKQTRNAALRKAPSSFDKQVVRDYGTLHGVTSKLDPENPVHIAKAHALVLPPEVIEETRRRYRYIFWRLTGMTIDEYARTHLQVPILRLRVPRVALVFGSRSDLDAVQPFLDSLRTSPIMDGIGAIFAHIISCHRNPDALRAFVEQKCNGADVVVAIAGKAAALPGVLDALIHAKGLSIPVIGVGMSEENSRSRIAAQLSIEELPQEPVIIDEMRGRAYMGVQGLEAALRKIAEGELPPPKARPIKKAEHFVFQVST